MTPDNPQIQAIVEQYKKIGWDYVKVHDFGKRLPTVTAWDRSSKFRIHLELGLKNRHVAIHHISLFGDSGNGVIGGFYFQGQHLTPEQVKTIIETVTGKAIALEAKEELAEATQ